MVGKESEITFVRPQVETKPDVVKVQDLFVNSDKGVLAVNNLSFDVAGGEIIGIAGVSGNGQVELADALTGNRDVIRGKIFYQGKDISNDTPEKRIDQGISYVPGDRIRVGVAENRDREHRRLIDRASSARQVAWPLRTRCTVRQHWRER